MKKWQKYEIPFVGLKDGKHTFSYSLNQAFYESHESNIPGPGEFNALVEFNKKQDFFVLSFNIEGELVFPCDRCSEDFPLEINDNFQVIVKYKEEEGMLSKQDVDVVYISRGDTHFNVAQLLYELSMLSIPLRKIHPDDETGKPTCNEKLLRKWLSSEEDESETVDPRWEKLKKLQNK